MAKQSTSRIVPEAAVQRAMQYLRSLMTDVRSPRLEELELSDNERFWFVTLSFDEPAHGVLGYATRSYKIFKIDALSGEVRSMKIREVRGVA